ncbi:MAG: hypothetical protein A3I04_07275 [Nitrospinae bacterium RIFCSPLOWO2_02_FULL_39_110]|nr:MAG: hypothetical protein A2W53_06625 [Nitrospinae bacterium RIFCSPHIGHO2_02_39_11]OGW00464.1 MAG: hypothetical protein A3D97_02390 [Nitrospinae bacterium RIFCSPHIGHO2_12_FULL_39_42]OGW02758.1 MAG: hypothetical protein A3D20_02780 [Nitrospinae bacterium RIFCSPHIGHO2_02_FULL_39_82]OGW04243.1 MAG: hypothetical protein A3I04_07275 [Nitrospinae bacterium RIFCSPLOWO2_02_FULL_39_110]OGW06095.1 MAG: hypothetical protein A2Z59_09780 [Nitrospinae bacterium RIFCSPLOWO2_02_39_17]OGW09585.1 MAG: hypoth
METDTLLNDSRGLIDLKIKSYFKENADFVLTIIDGFFDFIIVACDYDGNIVAYNMGCLNTLGYTYEDMNGIKELYTLFPRDFNKSGKLQEEINTLFQKGRVSFELEMERKNGEKFPAKVMFILSKDTKGKLVGFLMIGEDITRLKENEEKLRRQVEELERFKKATIQRELRMEELKRKVKELEGRLRSTE